MKSTMRKSQSTFLPVIQGFGVQSTFPLAIARSVTALTQLAELPVRGDFTLLCQYWPTRGPRANQTIEKLCEWTQKVLRDSPVRSVPICGLDANAHLDHNEHAGNEWVVGPWTYDCEDESGTSLRHLCE